MSPSVLSLSCKNFRSYKRLALSFSSRFVVFYGENGAGKTNILEAISLFSSSRGLRKSPVADLNTINTPANSWNLDLVIQKDGYNSYLSTSAPLGRRIARIDNSSVSALNKFEDELWILWVIPALDNIFIGPTTDRRSFLDHLVSGHIASHKQCLKQLTTLQKERLHIIFNRKDENWLEVIENKIAEQNIAITKNRLEFIRLLDEVFVNFASCFLKPRVSLSGTVEKIYSENSEETAVLEIAAELKRNRYIDAEKQTTSISAQKTFWEISHEITNFEAANCSTGEQKAFLISLVLAALNVYKRTRKGTPVLLLDDLMVHLDRNRRKHLIEELLTINAQTFFTGTDRSLFEELSNIAQFYKVDSSICIGD